MTVDNSTLNVVLGAIIGLMAWMVRELIGIKLAIKELSLLHKSLACVKEREKCSIPSPALALVAFLAFSGSGCGSVLQARQERVPIVTSQAPPVIVTNVVQSAGLITTQLVAVPGPLVLVTNWVTNTVYEVRPEVREAIATVQTLNQANPTPTAPIINGVLLALSAALGIFAKVKSDKAALVSSLVSGIEAAGSAEVKTMIKRVATAAGVQEALHKEVKRLTG